MNNCQASCIHLETNLQAVDPSPALTVGVQMLLVRSHQRGRASGESKQSCSQWNFLVVAHTQPRPSAPSPCFLAEHLPQAQGMQLPRNGSQLLDCLLSAPPRHRDEVRAAHGPHSCYQRSHRHQHKSRGCSPSRSLPRKLSGGRPQRGKG